MYNHYSIFYHINWPINEKKYYILKVIVFEKYFKGQLGREFKTPSFETEDTNCWTFLLFVFAWCTTLLTHCPWNLFTLLTISFNFFCFPADHCAADQPDYRVAIGVGIALLVLIIIVVVAYLLTRKRRTDGYQSLWGVDNQSCGRSSRGDRYSWPERLWC